MYCKSILWESYRTCNAQSVVTHSCQRRLEVGPRGHMLGSGEQCNVLGWGQSQTQPCCCSRSWRKKGLSVTRTHTDSWRRDKWVFFVAVWTACCPLYCVCVCVCVWQGGGSLFLVNVQAHKKDIKTPSPSFASLRLRITFQECPGQEIQQDNNYTKCGTKIRVKQKCVL